MKRKFIVLLQTACLFLAALSLLAGFKVLATKYSLDFSTVSSFVHGWSLPSSHASKNTTGTFPRSDATVEPADIEPKQRLAQAYHQRKMVRRHSVILDRVSHSKTATTVYSKLPLAT